ncbi:hypothetical protein GQ457_04G021180 [Hibiscus cannabinus]
MHWQGVWQSFDRHGEVVDVFIPRRRNMFGERFGYVRMATRAAADRVNEQLNGFWLYGSRITVAFMVKADRDTSWRRRSERISRDQRQGSNHSVSGGHGGVYRRVTGVLDGSKKEVLETCAVAWCKGRLRGEALVTELRRAGFTGWSVMRAAGDVVLLLFVTAEERQSMPDRLDLDRWFVKVLPWSPNIGFDSRSVWLSVLGVPMQFWSQDTFRNVAQLWGSLVRLDESTMDPKSFEQARLLIETKHWDRIMETIEVDCDGRLVPVRVQELEVVHAHDVVCRCEEVDASSEESDRETAQDDLVELPGQVESGVTDNGEQDGPPGEKEITIWREEPLLAVSGEDRPTFSNPDLVGEENLSVVPIEVSAVVPGQSDVSHSNPKSLAFGKRLGIRIEGNEEEARHGVNSENLMEQRIEIAFPQKTKHEILSMVEASKLFSDVDFEFSTVKRFGKVSEQAKLWESTFVVVVTISSKKVFGGDFSTVKHMGERGFDGWVYNRI